MDPTDATGAYPRPIYPPATVDREQAMREFRERQAQRRRVIQAKRKVIRDARKAGKPFPADFAALRVIGVLEQPEGEAADDAKDDHNGRREIEFAVCHATDSASAFSTCKPLPSFRIGEC